MFLAKKLSLTATLYDESCIDIRKMFTLTRPKEAFDNDKKTINISGFIKHVEKHYNL